MEEDKILYVVHYWIRVLVFKFIFGVHIDCKLIMMFPFQVSCLCKWTEHILISPMEEIPTAAFHAICNTKIS